MAEHQHMILPDGRDVVVIHFAVPWWDEAGEAFRIACMPHQKELHLTDGRPFPFARTQEPGIVNCPMCRETEEWRSAARMARIAVPGAEKQERSQQPAMFARQRGFQP